MLFMGEKAASKLPEDESEKMAYFSANKRSTTASKGFHFRKILVKKITNATT